jgi:hypothetical protein
MHKNTLGLIKAAIGCSTNQGSQRLLLQNRFRIKRNLELGQAHNQTGGAPACLFLQ